jgi:hypothetical protein
MKEDIFWEVPAEIVLEPAKYGGYNWCICQPDCVWAVWEQGPHKYAFLEDAFRDAQKALSRIHLEQGFE